MGQKKKYSRKRSILVVCVEKSYSKLVVVYIVLKMDSWKMCKDKEGETQHG